MDGPSRTQDEWIALRCQAGEHNAFEDLVALMERPLLYYATKLTGNAETALDVLQDVWMKACKAQPIGLCRWEGHWAIRKFICWMDTESLCRWEWLGKFILVERE